MTQRKNELEKWWNAFRGRTLKMLALRLGISRAELLRRLGVPEEGSLRFPEPLAPPRLPENTRPRGRPARHIDRQAVLAALRETSGNVRAASRITGLPRVTLGRYVQQQINPAAYQYGALPLREEHALLLGASGISPEVARMRCYTSTPKGLRVPVWTAQGQGQTPWFQLRRDKAKRTRDRYWNAPGAFPVVDVSPYGRSLALDTERPLYVAESPRKADAAVSLGLACVAVQGAEMVCLDAGQWNYIGVRDRDVFVVFDADTRVNPRVGEAEQRLCAFLHGLGARVHVVRLPTLPRHPKAGLDDYLASGHDESDLTALAHMYLPPGPGAA